MVQKKSKKNSFRFQGKVEIFPVESPWIYVAVPDRITKITKEFAERGLVAVTAKLGKSEWNTSLMPKGDGTTFVPLNKKVCKTESIELGDTVRLEVSLRKR